MTEGEKAAYQAGWKDAVSALRPLRARNEELQNELRACKQELIGSQIRLLLCEERIRELESD